MRGHFTSNWLGEAVFVPVEPDPDELMERMRDELERDQAAYDAMINRKLDEWKETGVRPAYRRTQ